MANRLNKILIVIIIGMVLFVSAGYSLLNKELLISGELIYRAETDIRITNVKLDSVSNTIEDFSPEFSKDEVILGFDMQTDTSTIAYKIEITNLIPKPREVQEFDNTLAKRQIEIKKLKSSDNNLSKEAKEKIKSGFDYIKNLKNIKEL